MNTIKGYKVFDPNWTCRGKKYECPGMFEEDVTPSCCNYGIHFCQNLADCFYYYDFNPENKVAEVIAIGDTDTNGIKICTNKLKIIREIQWEEVLRIVNTGDYNTGYRNTGDYNTGYCNSGNCNSGDRNTGNYNTGYCNTGDYNKTNFSSGCFNTKEANIMLFDKMSNWTYRTWLDSDARRLLTNIQRRRTEWVTADDMTTKEKMDNPAYKTTGGYLKTLDELEIVQKWWDDLPESDKETIKSIPNFDPHIFEECTGIKVQ